jgi:hypothetical protein
MAQHSRAREDIKGAYDAALTLRNATFERGYRGSVKVKPIFFQESSFACPAGGLVLPTLGTSKLVKEEGFIELQDKLVQHHLDGSLTFKAVEEFEKGLWDLAEAHAAAKQRTMRQPAAVRQLKRAATPAGE